MFTFALFSPILAPFGLGLALWAYPWRTHPVRPYLWIVLILLAPLVCMIALQTAFGLPAGACVERSLNNVPIILALISIIGGVVLTVLAKGYRRFIAGVALAVGSITLSWSMIAVMSLAGCWI